MRHRVVGVDPGLNIGMSLFVDGEYSTGAEIRGVPDLLRTLDGWEPSLLVVEDFYGGYATSNQKDPIRVIGACEAWSWLRGTEMVLQSPGILRTRLKLADGLHRSRHVRCSAAHVLHYFRKVQNSVG